MVCRSPSEIDLFIFCIIVGQRNRTPETYLGPLTTLGAHKGTSKTSKKCLGTSWTQMSPPGPKWSITCPNSLTLIPSHPSIVDLEISFDSRKERMRPWPKHSICCENQGHPRRWPSGNMPIRTRITPLAIFVLQKPQATQDGAKSATKWRSLVDHAQRCRL